MSEYISTYQRWTGIKYLIKKAKLNKDRQLYLSLKEKERELLAKLNQLL